MQKLQEASDRRRVTHAQRKGTVWTKQEKNLFLSLSLFQQRPAECKHLANWWRTPCIRLLDDALANPSTGRSRHLLLLYYD